MPKKKPKIIPVRVGTWITDPNRGRCKIVGRGKVGDRRMVLLMTLLGREIWVCHERLQKRLNGGRKLNVEQRTKNILQNILLGRSICLHRN